MIHEGEMHCESSYLCWRSKALQQHTHTNRERDPELVREREREREREKGVSARCERCL